MDQTYPIPEITHEPALTQIAAAAILTGAFTGLVTLSAAAALLIIAPDLRPYWPIAILAIPLLITAAASGFYGIHWIKQTAARQWDYTTATEYADDTDYTDDDTPTASDDTGQAHAILDAGYRILVLHYVHGQQVTRPEAEQAGIQQADWNVVNTILQTMQVKHSRTWNTAIPAAQAFELWQSIQFMPSGRAVMVPVGHGEYKRVSI